MKKRFVLEKHAKYCQSKKWKKTKSWVLILKLMYQIGTNIKKDAQPYTTFR